MKKYHLATLLCAGVLVLTGCPEEDKKNPRPQPPNPLLDMNGDMKTDMTDMPTGDMSDMTDMPAGDMSDMTDMNDMSNDMPDMAEMCVPLSDAELCQQNNFECGPLTVEMDNCGDKRENIDCGDPATVCQMPESCGGGGTTGQCGCTPTTCESEGVLCGQIPDSCGGMLNCDAFCVDSIVSGDEHSCAIGSGKLKCWGQGGKGQLGNGSSRQENNPVDVVDLPANALVTQATAGGRHTCALLNDTSLVCWGENNRGQLGVGTTVDSNKPGMTAISNGVIKVVAGIDHTCALVQKPNVPVQEGYGVKCWGSNQYGQIGDPTLFIEGISVKSPRDVSTLDKGVLDIAAGSYHTCAQLVDGTMRCWGRNNFGQLGNLSSNASFTDAVGNKILDIFGWDKDIVVSGNKFDNFVLSQIPVSPQISDVIAMSAGRGHTCAITRNRELFCWGALADRAPGNAGTACKWQLNGVKSVKNTGAPVCTFNDFVNDRVVDVASSECAIFPDTYDPNSGGMPLAEFAINPTSYGTCGTKQCDGRDFNVTCPTGVCDATGRCKLEESTGPNNNLTYKLNPSRVIVSKAYLTPHKIAELSYVEQVSSGRDHVCVLIDGKDTDGDTILDRVELGPNVIVPANSDTDNRPDFRDSDSDDDGISDRDEAGDDDPGTPPLNTDGDNLPNYLDPDSDDDTVADGQDNCPLVANTNQADADNNGVGDACENDADGDTILDDVDNCPKVVNTDQNDIDSNGVGDACQSFSTNIRCFGINEVSQLGNGSDSPASKFQDVLEDSNSLKVRATGLASGGSHTCALVDDSNAKCWGSNKAGQIGNSALMRETSAKPFDVKLDTK